MIEWLLAFFHFFYIATSCSHQKKKFELDRLFETWSNNHVEKKLMSDFLYDQFFRSKATEVARVPHCHWGICQEPLPTLPEVLIPAAGRRRGQARRPAGLRHRRPRMGQPTRDRDRTIGFRDPYPPPRRNRGAGRRVPRIQMGVAGLVAVATRRPRPPLGSITTFSPISSGKIRSIRPQ